MSVNRNVTVAVGWTYIRYESSLSSRGTVAPLLQKSKASRPHRAAEYILNAASISSTTVVPGTISYGAM